MKNRFEYQGLKTTCPIFVNKIDLRFRFQAFKQNYCDRERPSAGEKLSIMAFIEEIQSAVLEKKVLNMENNKYHMLLKPGPTPKTKKRSNLCFAGKRLMNCFFSCPLSRSENNILVLEDLFQKNSSNF